MTLTGYVNTKMPVNKIKDNIARVIFGKESPVYWKIPRDNVFPKRRITIRIEIEEEMQYQPQYPPTYRY